MVDRAERLTERGRESDAEALYRRAISAAPQDPRAHVALAKLRAARGEGALAIDALVEAAREVAQTAIDPDPIYSMLGVALELDPDRLELHVDLAEAQAAAGDVHGAQLRLTELAKTYFALQRHEEARDIIEFANAWDPQPTVAGVIDIAISLEESIPILLDDLEERLEASEDSGIPGTVEASSTACIPTVLRDASGAVLPPLAQPPTERPRTSSETVCTPTLLRDAAGAVLPNQAQVPRPPADPARRRSRRTEVPAPRTERARPKTGRAPQVPKSKSALRTLRARAKVRGEQPAPAPASGSLARRLRKLSGLPR